VKSPITKLLLLFIIIGTLSTSNGHSEHSLEGEVEVVYDIIESNNATNIWYDSISNDTQLYHVENGSQMTLTIHDIQDEQTDVSFQIGNLTISNVPDKDAEEVFSYGYWQVPATFGFVANNTWTTTKIAMDNIEFESFNFSLPHLQYLGGEVDAIIVEFKDTFQSTRLIYDDNTGMLLEAHSEVFGFQLSISINSINGDKNYHRVESSSNSSEETLTVNSIIIFAAMFTLISTKTIRR
jgi:hypothetical protein